MGVGVHAYISTFHDSTGYSPYFLMFERHPRLAIDAFFGLNQDVLAAKTHTEYVRKLRQRLHFAYQKASREAKKSAAHHKSTYDLKARSSVIQPGDRVFVRNVGIHGKHKLADRWEHKRYIVRQQPNPDISLYLLFKKKVAERSLESCTGTCFYHLWAYPVWTKPNRPTNL